MGLNLYRQALLTEPEEQEVFEIKIKFIIYIGLPMTIEEEQDREGASKLAGAFQGLHNSKTNQKVISVLSLHQTSIQHTNRSQGQKSRVEKLNSVTSYVSQMSKRSGMLSGFYPRADMSVESNIPGRVH